MRSSRACGIAAALAASLCPGFLYADTFELVITELSISPIRIDAASGESTEISFRSTRQGQAIVRLYGPDWRAVRELTAEDIEPHVLVRLPWDGRDDAGEIVPSEAYFPVVEFVDHGGQVAVLDPTLQFRTGPVILEELRFDEEKGVVGYTLGAPARVTLHAGIDKGGPLLRTLVPDEPRAAGKHEENWDGWDEARFVNIAAEKDFHLFADGIALCSPSVIVKGSDTSYATYQRKNPERALKGIPEPGDTAGLAASALRPHDVIPEPRFQLSVPGAPLSNEGLPIVSGTVPVQVALQESIRIPIIEERFEIILFSDLEFVTEVEEGHSPAIIPWDSNRAPDGERLLTINVATLSGQMSSASLRVAVRNDRQ